MPRGIHLKKEPNRFAVLEDDSIKVYLSQGVYVLINKIDWEHLRKYRWCANNVHGNYYAVAYINSKKITMGRVIMGEPKGKIVDHKLRHDNEKWIDNRRHNLRITDKRGNSQNSRKRKNTTSKFKGVSWSKTYKKWHVCIQDLEGNRRFLGYFTDEIEAAELYDASIILHQGIDSLTTKNFASQPGEL